MLDVEPIAFLDAASVSDSNSAFFSNAVTDAYPIINLVDSTTGVPFSDGDALQLDSYYIDSSGYALAPSYGETVYKRVAVQNTGNAYDNLGAPVRRFARRVRRRVQNES